MTKAEALKLHKSDDGWERDGGFPVVNKKVEDWFPKTPFQTWLRKHFACFDARVWVWDKTFEVAWSTCRNLAYMKWALDEGLHFEHQCDLWKDNGKSQEECPRCSLYQQHKTPVQLRKAFPYIRLANGKLRNDAPKTRKKKAE